MPFSRRATFASLAAASITPDPAFAAIAKYRAAFAALEVARPATFAATERKLLAALDALLATTPTTIHGCRALAEFMIEDGADDAQTLEVLRRGLDRLAAA
jgi:hypothetical protein